jgi:hypothetical protein
MQKQINNTSLVQQHNSPMNLKLWKTLIFNEVEFYIEVISRKVRS